MVGKLTQQFLKPLKHLPQGSTEIARHPQQYQTPYIADDFRIGKFVNYTLKHFIERVKIYDDEKFNYKFYNIELKNGTNDKQ